MKISARDCLNRTTLELHKILERDIIAKAFVHFLPEVGLGKAADGHYGSNRGEHGLGKG